MIKLITPLVTYLDEVPVKVVRVLPEVRVGLEGLVFCPELHKPAVVVSKGTLDAGGTVGRVVEQPCYLLSKVG